MSSGSTLPVPPHQSSRADLTGLRAGFVSRAVAIILDVLIILVLAGVTYLLIKGTMTLMRIDVAACRQFVPIVDVRSLIANACRLTRISMTVIILSIAPIYLMGLWLFGGRTIGMGIVGLRVVRTNGQRLHLYTAFIRLLGFALCLLTLGLGFAWAIIDNERQALHDKIAGTCVIYYTGKLMQQHLNRPAAAATTGAATLAQGATAEIMTGTAPARPAEVTDAVLEAATGKQI